MLICGICGKKIKQPKYLPCHHSFCFNCIFNTVKSNQQKITCVACMADHTLSFEQMNMLADDSMKSNLIIPFMNEKLKSFQKTKCDICDDDEEPGVSACVDCEIFLCDLHQKAHFKAKETKTHQLIMHPNSTYNPYLTPTASTNSKHNSQSSVGSMKQHTPTSSNSLALIPSIPSPTHSDLGSTPPNKRKFDDTSDDERTPRKRGRKAGAHDQKWDQNFEILKTMKAQTGNFNFIRDNPALHGWVQYMKAAYKRGKLAPERVEALDQIGFTWTTEKLQIRWDQRLEQLRAYKELHGHCNVPSTAKGDYAGLGQWLASTRMKKRKGHLSASKTQDLEDIGVEWSLKRTTKNTTTNNYYQSGSGASGGGGMGTPGGDDFEYDDGDDSGSNLNDNDDYDDDDLDNPTTPIPTTAASTSSASSTSASSSSSTPSSSNHTSSSSSSSSGGHNGTPQSTRSYPPLPPPPQPNFQQPLSTNSDNFLAFLDNAIGEVKKQSQQV